MANSDNATVVYTAKNSTTLGSGLPIPGMEAAIVEMLNSNRAETGPFSEVGQTFVCTETYSR